MIPLGSKLNVINLEPPAGSSKLPLVFSGLSRPKDIQSFPDLLFKVTLIGLYPSTSEKVTVFALLLDSVASIFSKVTEVGETPNFALCIMLIGISI